jgi:hypothetical protein
MDELIHLLLVFNRDMVVRVEKAGPVATRHLAADTGVQIRHIDAGDWPDA